MRYDAPLVDVEDLFPTKTTTDHVATGTSRPFGLTLTLPIPDATTVDHSVGYSDDLQVSTVEGTPAVHVARFQPLVAKKQATTMDHQTWDDELTR